MFGYAKPKNDEERNKDVRDIIYDRIIKFRNAAFTFSGWKDLLNDGDANEKCGVRFVD